MTTTPNLALPLVAPDQAQKHVPVNEAFAQLDALVQLTVISAALSTPPGAPVNGDRYIVAAGPTGAWVGHAKHVAIWASGAWIFYAPTVGWRAFNQATSALLIYQAGAWTALAGGGGTSLVDIPDNGFNWADNLDPTKRLFLQLSGLTTGTSRTLTAPDATGTMALLSGTQTFIGTQNFYDSSFNLVDNLDVTKIGQFQLSGLSTATTRTLTWPDASGTIALLSGTQTFAGATTFAAAATFSGTSVDVGTSVATATYTLGAGATGSGATKTINIGTLGVSGSITDITLGSGVVGATGSLTFNLPPRLVPQTGDPASPLNGMLWYNSSTGKFRGREAGASVDLIGAGGGGSVFSDTALFVQDNADATKQLQFELSGLTTGTTRTLTVPDVSGTIALLSGTQSFAGVNTFASGSGSFSTGAGGGTVNLGSGATTTGNTKTVNIGTGGVSGSTTNIALGPTPGAGGGTLVCNIPMTLVGQSSDPTTPADGTLWYNSTAGELRARLNGITRVLFGTPFPHQDPAAGSYITTTTTGMGGATGTIAGVANQMDIFPFIPRADMTIDRLSVNVTTLIASALGKIVVYDADAAGKPNNLIVETATLDFSTTGIKEATVSLTFRAGVTYWIGMRTSSTATLSAWAAAATPELTANGITVNPRKLLRRTLTFGTAAPATWSYLVSEVTNATTAIATAIWLRSA